MKLVTEIHAGGSTLGGDHVVFLLIVVLMYMVNADFVIIFIFPVTKFLFLLNNSAGKAWHPVEQDNSHSFRLSKA